MKKEIFDFYSYLRISGTQAAARRLEAEKAGIHVPVFLQADISARCNLSCPGCENGCVRTKHQEELLELEQWDGLFRGSRTAGSTGYFSYRRRTSDGKGDPGAGFQISELLVSGFYQGNTFK